MNTNHIEAARLWRTSHGYEGRGGVIVVFEGTVQGWMNELRDANQWQPGCSAVDEAGHTWIAVGGNAQRGAVLWMPVDSAAWIGTR